eukprot:gnl/MRDRNA2_/MRDRNA2_105308_c0_seq1.p1 gnl/MRDRNA2_/MRDRNA2_105308_c0~~gnl/MRDRNA2_/MRDRNA2_105308_c0_seq1.p1  ORF type:complete len:254 (+),score=42.34 gnl/MRDRNA2_/MRDRNA2_105308_c0_seq1:103-762(+)
MPDLHGSDSAFSLEILHPKSITEILWWPCLIGLGVLCFGRLIVLDLAGSFASASMAGLALHMVVKIPSSLTRNQVPCMLALLCAINFAMDIQSLRRGMTGRTCQHSGDMNICKFFDSRMGFKYNMESALTALSPAMQVFGLLVCTISILQYFYTQAEGDLEATTKKEENPLLSDATALRVPADSSDFAMAGFGAPAYRTGMRSSKQMHTRPFEGAGHRL